MPKRCAVPNCPSKTSQTKLSHFGVPSTSTARKAWETALGTPLIKTQVVCELHFDENDVIKERTFSHEGNVIAVGHYKHPKLKDHAIPFLTVPSSSKRPLDNDENPESTSTSKRTKVNIVECQTTSKSNTLPSDNTSPIYQEIVKISLPPSWVRIVPSDKSDYLIFANFVSTSHLYSSGAIPFKEVQIFMDGKISYHCLGKAVNFVGFEKYFNTVTSLEETITLFQNTQVCSGIQKNQSSKYSGQDIQGNWRHKLCPMILSNKEGIKHCSFCLNLNRLKQSRKVAYKTSNKYRALRRRFVKTHKNKTKHEQQLKKLNNLINHYSAMVKEKSETSLQNIVDNKYIPPYEKTVIQEIIKAAKHSNTKGRRYSENWILLCLLLHIRSPAAYNLLRSIQLLPLPAPKTVRNYLRLIDMECGFDRNFFELFKKKMEEKGGFQRHGILLFDEIQVRESVTVNSKNLTYVGLTNYGVDMPEKKGTNLDQKANHGLVLMFQALGDNYTQPIGVFASKGPVDGTSLAQIVLKAIILLEKASAYVHGFVADGAQTNRKLWNELGLSAKNGSVKNFFEHPLYPNRKVFAFSDTPHLIKCIRNRLYNEKTLRISPDEEIIKWDHLKILHKEDMKLPGNLRVCPKITSNHLNLTTTSKMRVKLATQIFSKSVADGLKFYQSHQVNGLEDCDGTANFCRQINDMFDALNRKVPSNGVKPGTKDFEVLKSSIIWLDQWEDNYKKGKITAKQFLSSNTAEGLRMTLQSAIDLSTYLREHFNFSYLLTGKINQDCLEKFFGTIRQAGGQNDQPATPTFLQLYKLLSVYSIIKPPKYGNCSVTDEPVEQLISISEIKEIFSIKSCDNDNAVHKIKEKMNGVIESSEWEIEDIIDDLSFAKVVDCVIYYVTGYLCKQIKKYTKCDICLQSIITEQQYSRENVAQLTNMKTYGGLIHPNINFFKIIRNVEETFLLFSKEADVFDRTMDHLLDNTEFSFPCSEHKEEIMVYAIKYYLTLRMRQYTREHNREKIRENMDKKKKAKFSTH